MARSVIVTLIRHGESEDNKRAVWAGWKDAPLSSLGRKQAEAAASHFVETQPKVDIVYASDLLRAQSTGRAVHQAAVAATATAETSTELKFILTKHLREQHFGIAEGKEWTVDPIPKGMSYEEAFQKGLFPVFDKHQRDSKFPEGESLNDLGDRAAQVVKECVVPHLNVLNDSAESDFHIVLASHGLCISEVVPALLKLDASGKPPSRSYAGLLNTAWTRVVITKSAEEGATPAQLAPGLPPLKVQVTDINKSDHLAGVKETEPVESSSEETAAQAEARAFFGGATTATNANHTA